MNREQRNREHKRLHIAGIFLVCFAVFLVVLMVQSGIEHKRSLTPDAGTEGTLEKDPLGLVQVDEIFELVGISEGGSVIGYTCALEPSAAARAVVTILLPRGWLLLDENVKSDVNEENDRGLDGDAGADASAYPGTTLSFSYPRTNEASAFLFVQCVRIPGGSSVIVEVL